MIKFTNGANCLKIRDTITFSYLNPNLIKVRDDFAGGGFPSSGPLTAPSKESPMKGLLVSIAATHSGMITRNNGFYVPEKMKKGAASFLDNYNKPILVHHDDEHSDPIGRIIDAKYVDTSGLLRDRYDLKSGLVVKDKFGKEKGIINETFIKDFVEGRMPWAMQLDAICTLLRDGLLNDDKYPGMGYINLTGNITDKEAVEKLLDGRYLTGSVGATTDRAVCSVCKQDYVQDGRCEHIPGKIYDGSKCFIISGELCYDEYSFVNIPADRHSRVLELHYNGIKDSIEVDDSSNRIYEVRLGFPQYDSDNKEDSMAVKVEDAVTSPEAKKTEEVKPEVKLEDKVEEKKEEVQDDYSAGKPRETDDKMKETPPKFMNGESGEHASDCPCAKCEKVKEHSKEKEVAKKDEAQEEGLDAFLTRVLETKDALSEKDSEHLYDLLQKEIDDAVKEGELVEVKDAKLSTEKRKKLAKSTFCGPGKSFPVPDCAHVTAARRLIGKYKGEGSKASILACVSRKAKALGCGSEKKKDAAEVTPIIPVVTETKQEVKDAVVETIVTPTVDNSWKHADTIRNLLENLEGIISDEDQKLVVSLIKKLTPMITSKDMLDYEVGAWILMDAQDPTIQATDPAGATVGPKTTLFKPSSAASRTQVWKGIQHALEAAGTSEDKENPSHLSEDEKKMLSNIMKRLGGIMGKDAFVASLVEQEVMMSPECEANLLDEVVKNEELIGNLRDELDALRKEYTNLFRDMEELGNQVIDSKATSRKTSENYLRVLKTLKDSKTSVEDFTKLSDEVIASELVKLSGEVDLVKITDKIDNGMSKEPTGIVALKDAIQEQSKVKVLPDQKSDFQTMLPGITETYKMLLKEKGGQKKVETYVRNLKDAKLIPDDVNLVDMILRDEKK